MCAEPTSLAVLMAKADKYATADSAMRIKVTTSDKVMLAPATPKPAGDNRGGQNNHKRKADQMANDKLVANVEGETSASQAGPPRKRRKKGNPNWQPRQTLEQLLDAPCKIHSGAVPSTHTLRQYNIARRLSQGEGLPAPPDKRSQPGIKRQGHKTTRLVTNIMLNIYIHKKHWPTAHVRYIPSGVEQKTQREASYGTSTSRVVPAAAPDVVETPPPAPPEVDAPSPLLRPPAPLIPESAYAPLLEVAADSVAQAASSALPLTS
ncbi:hypothetical protein D1007_38733 [Hordeum vulgare]|nr:hypothetical protein D1007_38733 [Hordeum vulgare]